MTHPMAVEELRAEAIEEPTGDEIAPPLLAAIQHSYEEAMACIDALARSSSPVAEDGTGAHPRTEKIDLPLFKPLPLRETATPPTAAMSVAARLLAEQPASAGAGSPAAASEACEERPTAPSDRNTEATSTLVASDLPTAPSRRRRWWRS